jgi:hypothetical protein
MDGEAYQNRTQPYNVLLIKKKWQRLGIPKIYLMKTTGLWTGLNRP